ncbi:MAG: hypothetical protein J6X28_04055 [Bacilli bacterium]|nr:hypothetical protein [Bacilli bacterium]
MAAIRNRETSRYTFYSAKKLYFARTPSKCLLMEKNEVPKNRGLSLNSRRTTIMSRENGILLFPKTL